MTARDATRKTAMTCWRSDILLLVFLAFSLAAGPQNTSAAAPDNVSAGFDAANKLYEQGKFDDAITAYEKLLQSGTASAAIYFNLGNAFYKSGQAGRAIAAYRQAEQLKPRDPDLRANLQFVRNQIQGPTLAPDRWQRWLRTLTLNEWTVLASIGLWVWMLLLTAGQVRPNWKPALRTSARSAGLAAVALCLCLAAAFLANTRNTAIVVAPEAIVHSGPIDASQTAFVVHDGAELTVLDHKNDWIQVSVGNRRIGWLKRADVLLDPQRA